jgi:DNA-binding transcriptional MerR regulator
VVIELKPTPDEASTDGENGKSASNGRRRRGRSDRTLYTTGEMARLSDNTLRTVRFYEEAGILQPVRRTDGGHRLFEQEELQRLMLVTDMRSAGMSLEEIKHALEMKGKSPSGGAAARATRALIEAQVIALDEKLVRLARLRSDLEQTLKVVEHCESCEDTPEGEGHFPDRCVTCGRIAGDELPRAMKVLWSARPEAGADPAETDDET